MPLPHPQDDHPPGPENDSIEAAGPSAETSFVLFDGPPDGLFGGFTVPANCETMEEKVAVASIMCLNPDCDEQTARMVWRALR